MPLCECCRERDAHPLCTPWCVECARPATCSTPNCNRELSPEDNADWSPENQVDCQCSRCRETDEVFDWIDSTCDRVEQLAEEHGWHVGRWQLSGSTRSRYVELTRTCSACSDDADEACACESLKVRVSDHGSCYCSEDVSLAMHPSGDDHTIEDLEGRLTA